MPLIRSLVRALVLLVVAVTGCILVFELPMDRWLDPSVSYALPGPALPLANLASAALAVAPGQTIAEFNFSPAGTSVMAKMSGGRRVYLDPTTAPSSAFGRANRLPSGRVTSTVN